MQQGTIPDGILFQCKFKCSVKVKRHTVAKYYQQCLSQHLVSSTCFSSISHVTSDHKIMLLKEREAYWQNQLRTLVNFGGLNKSDARKETKTKVYQKTSWLFL